MALCAALVYLAVSALSRWDVLLASVVSLGVTVIAAWYVLSRRGVARAVAAGVAALALLVFLVVVIASESVVVLVVGLTLAAVSVAAASYALIPASAAIAAERAPQAKYPVLLMNLKSGGGKAERFRLVELCRQRGIEPVVLHPGDDLRQLAEDAVARGADILGMAGGDGSQALVASVASQHRIPFVVVPAGTRNHFALDLGLDRADVQGALDAYEDGVDTVVDLAEINGRVFVNNASMGVYAKIVQSGDYRDAKVHTAAAMLPDLLGPEATPLDLRFTLPSGQEASSAQLLLVSNNPYALARLRGGGTRERLDRGVLGIAFLRVDSAGRQRSSPPWTPRAASSASPPGASGPRPSSRCAPRDPVEVGVDGEALTLQPPLRFVTRPGALTIRLPRSAPGRSPAARTVRVMTRPTVVALWLTVLGRPSADPMTGLTPVEPVEERLADRLSARRGDAGPSWAVRALRRLGRLDRAAYRAVADLSTPGLDRPLRRVSNLANFSKPWFVIAGVLALFGGARGRRAAVTGVAAIGLTSLVVNQPMKLAGRRGRPDRTGMGVPENRWVRMPTSTSFPSGHSASAAAFVVAVGDVLPQLNAAVAVGRHGRSVLSRLHRRSLPR